MTIQTPTRPGSAAPDDDPRGRRTSDAGPSAEAPRGGLAARVSLGRLFAPVPNEFVLIASTAIVLTAIGLVMVLSATSATSTAAGLSPFEAVMKQAVFALIGLPMMFILSRMPVGFWKKIAWPLLGAATIFQLLVFVPGLGVSQGGNTNWISIAGYTMQPSEFLKLALAIWVGMVLFRKQTRLAIWHHVFIPLVPVVIAVIGTVLAGHDLGTAMILLLIVLGGLFFSGVKLRIFTLPLIVAGGVAVYFAVTNSNRLARILSFASTDCNYYDECYQPMHGLFGLARGGLFGLGLGNSKEKYSWLPAASNDYIFAITGEELGLIGCVVVLVLFAIYAVGAFHIIRRTDDAFVRIVAGGITVWIIGQALINIGVVLRVVPVLGVPLPFMSQGGTALLSVLFASGVLLSLARSLPPHRAKAAARPASTMARPARSVRGRLDG